MSARGTTGVRREWYGVVAHVLAGAVVGMLLLHPVTKAIYGAEWQSVGSTGERLALAFTPRMLPMTGAFALLGSALGLCVGLLHAVIERHRRTLGFLRAELARALPALLDAGESEHVEFKASARWDLQRKCLNRDMEDAIARTIAGFLNHRGGTLLVGVADDGDVIGLAHDFATLRRKDRDGFERFVTDLVRNRLGGAACPLVHATFHRLGQHDVCRIIVEPSDRPAYYHDQGTARFFVRAGNSTRELDVRDAMEHVARRWPPRGPLRWLVRRAEAGPAS